MNRKNILNKIKLKDHKATVLSILFVVLCGLIIQGTYAWIHLGQDVNGALIYMYDKYPVELHKYERELDGTYTKIPMADIGFSLHKEDGTQIEGVYYTDKDGIIRVDLPVGKYYWKEVFNRHGWGPDVDDDGKEILIYPFEVTEDQDKDEPLIIIAYNIPLVADLEVEKIVVNKDGEELTKEQLDLEFEFTIEFSDKGTYKYYIIDNEQQDNEDQREYFEITSGEKFYLKHGQAAIFEDLPVGVVYKVYETPIDNYYVSSKGHTGNIIYGENRAEFTNTYHPVYGSLLVTKEVRNADGSELTQEQVDKEFLFTATIDGEEIQFVLKHGEEHLIPDLPVGTKYKVEEFDYINDEYYATTLIYEGEIQGEYQHLLPYINVYNPVEKLGDLIVRKVLVAPDGYEEELDYDLEFEFEATFEFPDDRPDEVITFKLKGDKLGDPSLWKIFRDLPVGTKYTIKELTTHGYWPDNDVLTGYIEGIECGVKDELSKEEIEDILENAQLATFYNRLPDKKIIEITKVVTGESPFEDENKEFLIKLYLDGELYEEFTLTAGEMKSFKVPAGVRFEVWEENYLNEGYNQLIINGEGIAWDDVTHVTVINDYFEERVDIEGEKTWSNAPGAHQYIPESIVVRLLLDGEIIEEKVVKPNAEGKWIYSFNAPKRDQEGNLYDYKIEEIPIDMFYPEYDGFNIHNEFINPVKVTLPPLVKQVTGDNAPNEKFTFVLKGISGAPMPVGSDGKELKYVQYGPGEQLLGDITFTTPGIYKYQIYEIKGDALNWEYDETIYYLEVTVQKSGDTLVASYKLTDGENEVDKALFINNYDNPEEEVTPEPDPDPNEKIVITGTKTWIHGTNPEDQRPKSLIIYLYANGELIQTIQTDASNNWNYSFELPKYDEDGNIIEYTVEEQEVEGYTGTKDEYDFTNTFDETSHPEVDTSDQTLVLLWLAAFVVSGSLIVCITIRNKLVTKQ